MDFIKSYCEEQTAGAGAEFAKRLQTGDVVCLNGELGSGKSVFARGIARGIGIKSDVTSPTFTIVNEYFTGRTPLYHFDAYRLSGDGDAPWLDEYFGSGGICVIEWSENITHLLPKRYYTVTIERDYNNTDYRSIKIEHIGD